MRAAFGVGGLVAMVAAPVHMHQSTEGRGGEGRVGKMWRYSPCLVSPGLLISATTNPPNMWCMRSSSSSVKNAWSHDGC